jgi:hypothetical protein
MDARLLFPKQYLCAADLRGRDVTLTISRLVQEDLRTDKGDEAKWIIYFAEMEERHRRDSKQINKRLVLNVTGAKAIAKLHGNETDDWVGKRITLFATQCMAFGSQTDCIRIRPTVPKGTRRRAPEPEPEQLAPDDIGSDDDAGDMVSLSGGVPF